MPIVELNSVNKPPAANRVDGPAESLRQGAPLTPPYMRISHTAVHGVKEWPMNVCSGRIFL